MTTAAPHTFGATSTANEVARAYAPANANVMWAIVTGGNSGIGAETVRALCLAGVNVVLACRTAAAGEAVAAELRAENAAASIRVMTVDLADGASIRAFAAAYLALGLPLNILVNNAGIMAAPRVLTKDGFEQQFGVNHLGSFLLTTLLLDKIKASGPARIITVASSLNRSAPPHGINFDDINWTKSYHRWTAYGNSKLANILFASELQRRLDAEGVKDVVSVSLHPGVILTNLFRHVIPEFFRAVLLPITRLFFPKSPQQGAATTVYAALAPQVVPGEFYWDCRVARAGDSLHAHYKNAEMAKRLWAVSEELWASVSAQQAAGASSS